MEHILNGGHIPFRKRRAEAVDPAGIGPRLFPEPVLYQVYEQFPDFPVGKGQLHLLAGQPASGGQVAGGIQNAPNVVDGVLNVTIGQLLPDRLNDSPAVDELLHLVPGGLVRLLEPPLMSCSTSSRVVWSAFWSSRRMMPLPLVLAQ